MSSTPVPSASDIPDRTLPLPARPNLEFERKRAKHLLRAIARGDSAALGLVRRHRADILPTGVKLADVQFAVAREYGFPGWPKLVAYHRMWDRHERTGPRFQSNGRRHYELKAQHLLDSHARGGSFATHGLASFVPRFYGRSDAEILAVPVTSAEAELVVARLERFSNWEALIRYADENARLPTDPDPGQWRASIERRYGAAYAEALDAIKSRDFSALALVVDSHPELLREPALDTPGASLLRDALRRESTNPDDESRAATDWLVSRGADITETASRMLLSGIHVSAEYVAFLLDRGADPNWLPPNGVPLLEHALLNYWNPEAVDMIASRVKPRAAFWIAAGLDDVPGMLRFLDRNGMPTTAARSHRPDFTLVGFPTPCRPDADDQIVLWEAFVIAGFNQRFAALDALLDRGFPIDSAPWGSTLLQWAQGNRVTSLVDYLTKRGARTDQQYTDGH